MTRKKIIVGGLLLGSVLAAGLAQAQGSTYLSLGVGQAQDSVLDASDTGWKLAGGGYLSRYFGGELELVGLGAPEAGNVEFDQGGVAVFGLARLPIGNRFDLFSKLGWFSWNVTASGEGIEGEASGSDLAWGVGAGFNFTKSFRMDLQFERFTDVLDSDVDMISLSAVYLLD